MDNQSPVNINRSIHHQQRRHPSADRPLVDWDLILIMEPLTIGGALAGSFLNKVRPYPAHMGKVGAGGSGSKADASTVMVICRLVSSCHPD